jgi:hypothetical protein
VLLELVGLEIELVLQLLLPSSYDIDLQLLGCRLRLGHLRRVLQAEGFFAPIIEVGRVHLNNAERSSLGLIVPDLEIRLLRILRHLLFGGTR